jgi:hypothetical protein
LVERVQKIFYVDDGQLGGKDAVEVQEILDFMTDSFEQVGLDVNTSKTVLMTNMLRFRNLQIAYSTKLQTAENSSVQREMETIGGVRGMWEGDTMPVASVTLRLRPP